MLNCIFKTDKYIRHFDSITAVCVNSNSKSWFCSEVSCGVFPVYLGSSFIQEALRRARELTDAAYDHTNER